MIEQAILDTSNAPTPIWIPSENWKTQSVLAKFIDFINIKYAPSTPFTIDNYEQLHNWSIKNQEEFWAALWHFFPIIAQQEPTRIKVSNTEMWRTKWFEGARLNFAENLLCANNLAGERDNTNAIIFISELGEERILTYGKLYEEVAKLSRALAFVGVQAGDRVVGYMPNIPETVIAMLACTSLGAVWSSCSCDFGAKGLEDRFLQIKPKVIFTVDGYSYRGKPIVTLNRVDSLIGKLDNADIPVVVIPYLSRQKDDNAHFSKTNFIEYSQFILQSQLANNEKDRLGASKIDFVDCAFDDPLYIMFSSGTTGKPKCIVHGIGGTLLQHAKEHALHSNLKAEDRILFFTTCGWMMWNWLVSALFIKATVVLYDGNPLYPHANILLSLVSKFSITHFGAGARYYQEIQQVYDNQQSLSQKVSASEPLNCIYNFTSLKVIFSTGSPLSRESFKFIYEQVSHDVQLSSISGGTDIISCFVLGAPNVAVYEGEIQVIGLGMAVEIFNEHQKSVLQEKGELVCTKAVPSMPIYFFNDAQQELYKNAYFSEDPQIWKHGDYAEIVPHINREGQLVSKGVIIYGRSDTTLNPGGVRIGTAEIYSALETLSQIEESLVVGRNVANDVEIVLFIKIREIAKAELAEVDTKLHTIVKSCIRKMCTARHVPQHIFQIQDLPKTASGKISEKSIKNLMDGKRVTNAEALINPKCLAEYEEIIKRLQDEEQ